MRRVLMHLVISHHQPDTSWGTICQEHEEGVRYTLHKGLYREIRLLYSRAMHFGRVEWKNTSEFWKLAETVDKEPKPGRDAVQRFYCNQRSCSGPGSSQVGNPTLFVGIDSKKKLSPIPYSYPLPKRGRLRWLLGLNKLMLDSWLVECRLTSD